MLIGLLSYNSLFDQYVGKWNKNQFDGKSKKFRLGFTLALVIGSLIFKNAVVDRSRVNNAI